MEFISIRKYSVIALPPPYINIYMGGNLLTRYHPINLYHLSKIKEKEI